MDGNSSCQSQDTSIQKPGITVDSSLPKNRLLAAYPELPDENQLLLYKDLQIV